MTAASKSHIPSDEEIQELADKLCRYTAVPDHYLYFDIEDLYYPHFWDLEEKECAIRLRKRDSHERVQVEEDRINDEGSSGKLNKATIRIQNHPLYIQYWVRGLVHVFRF